MSRILGFQGLHSRHQRHILGSPFVERGRTNAQLAAYVWNGHAGLRPPLPSR